MADDEVTDPHLRTMTLDQQIVATLHLLLEAQREVVPLARAALEATTARERAMADRAAAVSEWLRGRYGAPATGLVVVLLGLGVVSRIGGVDVDLPALLAAWVQDDCPVVSASPAPSSDPMGPDLGPAPGEDL